MLSAICFNLDQSKIMLSGNGLISPSLESASYQNKNLNLYQMTKFWTGPNEKHLQTTK